MEIIEQTSTKLVIIDRTLFGHRLALGILFGLISLPMGFSLVIVVASTVANSFFSAFISGMIFITPSLILIANILPGVNIFSFDKNLGYLQAKRWKPLKPYKIEEKEYLLETIDGVEIQTRLFNDEGRRMIQVICLVLDEGRERVDLHGYLRNFRKNERQTETVAKFLNVKNYGVIPLPK